MANRHPSPPQKVDVNASARALQAINLRKLGATYDQIARQCGYHDRASAYNAVKRELRRTLQAPADDLRILEAERLDDLWRVYIAKALRGDAQSARLALSIMERRAALLGLDAPKASGDANGNGPQTIVQAVHPAWAAAFAPVQPASPVTADGTQAVAAAMMPAPAIQEGVVE